MMAYEILCISTKILSDFDNCAFCLFIFYELGRISRINEVLKLVPLCKFMPTHEIKVYLVFFVFAEQKISENLYLRYILNPIVHKLVYKIKVYIFEFNLGKLPTYKIKLLLCLLNLIMLQMRVEKMFTFQFHPIPAHP